MSEQGRDPKAELLRIWSSSCGRAPRDQELAPFRLAIDALEACVKQAFDSRASSTPEWNLQDLNILKKFSGYRAPPGVSPPSPPSLPLSDRSQPASIVSRFRLDDSESTINDDIGDKPASPGTHRVSLRPRSPGHDQSSSTQSSDTQSAAALTWVSLSQPLPSSILNCIKLDIRSRKRKGCDARTTGPSRVRGYPCTLGCDRLFQSICDRQRHEEAVYPQKYWVCYICTQDRPLKGQFFFRRDKAQEHSNKFHSGQLDVDRSRVHGLRGDFPERCGICLTAFPDRHARATHIARKHSKLTTSGLAQVPSFTEISDIELQYLSANARSREDQSVSRLIPMTWLEKISEGATAIVYKVQIAYDLTSHCALPGPKTYAVKQYKPGYTRSFHQETAAYTRIAQMCSSSAITRCFGTFNYSHANGRESFNLMLELASGNLWDYMRCIPPPTTFVHIKKAYSQICELPAGLDGFHQPGPAEVAKRYGRHGDINPGNVLWFQDCDDEQPSLRGSTLKIADFGQAELLLLQGRAKPRSEASTLTYRPPECDIVTGFTYGSPERRRAYDVWCMGCVLLEFASWVVGGEDAVCRFKDWRRKCPWNDNPSAQLHDGVGVLPGVYTWNKYLKGSCHTQDTITRHIIDIVERFLLQPDPGDRLTADAVCDRLRQALNQGEREWRATAMALATVEPPGFDSGASDASYRSARQKIPQRELDFQDSGVVADATDDFSDDSTTTI